MMPQEHEILERYRQQAPSIRRFLRSLANVQVTSSTPKKLRAFVAQARNYVFNIEQDIQGIIALDERDQSAIKAAKRKRKAKTPVTLTEPTNDDDVLPKNRVPSIDYN